MCYLDILDNLPRLRLSSSQFKMILWIMKECGAKDVPSFNAFRSMQKHTRGMTGVRTEAHNSDLRNLFYVNDIRDLIAKDFANPEVSPHIQKYPEDVAGGPISEIWQVKDGKWHDIALDALTPSILINAHRYYIHEVAELMDGRWAIPTVHPEITRIPLPELAFNHEALERRIGTSIRFHGTLSCPPSSDLQLKLAFYSETCKEYALRIPNRFRAIDKGEDLFTVWVPVWADDVSAARSKQYQKHLNVYTANAKLPGRLLQQEYFVRFVSTSPHAGALEQLKVVVKYVKSTHEEPVQTYNADSSRPCGVRLNIPDGPADNPQQAEEAFHIGHQGNYFCRRCHVGGSNEEKECPDGYHSFYETGRPRNVEDIRNCVLAQIRLATYGVAARVEALQTATGTKDKIAQHWIDILIEKAREMHAATPGRSVDEELLVWLSNEMDQPYNPLLDLPFFDPSQDTLVEILHTILLGDAKYTWYELHHNWTAVQQDIFTVRLQSTNLDGLRVPPIRAAYMMQYRNGLIGKHFKTLMQTMIFHIHDIVTPEQFTLVRALGELGPLLWISEIDNMEDYLADLQILIDNLLDAFATLDPSKILIKLKLHVLLHIVQDIRRRGPAVRFSTEVFECFNAIFRLCSALSNHQAPSRDIAAKFADLDRVKHILTLSGGYWFQDTAWVRAGKDVQRILRNTPIIQKHLRWAPPPFWTPGLIRAVAQKKQGKMAALTVAQTMLDGTLNPCTVPLDSGISWTRGENVAAVSGDRCTVGSWAVFRLNDVPIIARILIILLPKGSKSAQGVLVVSKHDVGEALHPQLHMPVLLPDADASRVVVASASVQFSFNVQHDCRACGCDASGVTRQMQEHQESSTIIYSIVHKDDPRFVINTHGFHNAGLLRKYLPVVLTKPRHLFTDRRRRHDQLSAILGVTQKAKRAATQEKAAATREKKKAAKASTVDVEITGDAGGLQEEARPQKRPHNSI
ncbi:hypothetical protein B0H11DRAFT_1749386 [Mycena galericulata]|nr:hypothetical protein B0H11DRAFT_1749386 [Mycena galericulata]